MSDIFISYARPTLERAQQIARALHELGYAVWRDDELPPHRAYAEVIEERLASAKAVVVVWSADAVKSEWVRSEADRARNDRKLVQLRIDGARLPMPFDQIQCADLAGWAGDTTAPDWRKVVSSVAELVGGPGISAPQVTDPPLTSRPSIAVMPFSDMTGSQGQDYFADGMTVEVTNALSRFKSIFVTASSSALTFKGKGVGAREAARQLGVRYVLEGSVRKAANRVRIAVQLIDAADGAQIWTARFDDTLDDIFELQDKVAVGVAGQIGALLEQAEIRRASGRPTANLNSYDLYLQALPLLESFDHANDLKAIELVNRAIELDPGFGLALGLAAVFYARVTLYVPAADRLGYAQLAQEMAQRALQAAADDALVLYFASDALGSLEDDVAFATQLCERAIALNPGLAWAWFQSGWMHVRAGELSLGVERLEFVSRLDPISMMRAPRLAWIGVARFKAQRYAEAVALLRESRTLNPSYPITPLVLAACHGALGEAVAAKTALAQWMSLSQTPIDQAARWLCPQAAHREQFLAGIAVANGTAGSEASAGA